MKKNVVLHISPKPSVLSNKELLIIEREQDYFNDEEAETRRRNRRLTDRISRNPKIRK